MFPVPSRRAHPVGMERTSSEQTRRGATRAPVLAEAEVARRQLQLADLRAALASASIDSALAGRHRLVLRYQAEGPCEPSGPTDPQLHVFLAGGKVVVTTDGMMYHLPGGVTSPASDSAGAAAILVGHSAAPVPAAGR
jgi:hypothetical protein